MDHFWVYNSNRSFFGNLEVIKAAGEVLEGYHTRYNAIIF